MVRGKVPAGDLGSCPGFHSNQHHWCNPPPGHWHPWLATARNFCRSHSGEEDRLEIERVRPELSSWEMPKGRKDHSRYGAVFHNLTSPFTLWMAEPQASQSPKWSAADQRLSRKPQKRRTRMRGFGFGDRTRIPPTQIDPPGLSPL